MGKKAGGLIGQDNAGTCERELFECDLGLVEDTFQVKDVFDTQYHAFWSAAPGQPGFDNRDPANCPSAGNGPVDHECCGGHDRNTFGLTQTDSNAVMPAKLVSSKMQM